MAKITAVIGQLDFSGDKTPGLTHPSPQMLDFLALLLNLLFPQRESSPVPDKPAEGPENVPALFREAPEAEKTEKASISTPPLISGAEEIKFGVLRPMDYDFHLSHPRNTDSGTGSVFSENEASTGEPLPALFLHPENRSKWWENPGKAAPDPSVSRPEFFSFPEKLDGQEQPGKAEELPLIGKKETEPEISEPAFQKKTTLFYELDRRAVPSKNPLPKTPDPESFPETSKPSTSNAESEKSNFEFEKILSLKSSRKGPETSFEPQRVSDETLTSREKRSEKQFPRPFHSSLGSGSPEQPEGFRLSPVRPEASREVPVKSPMEIPHLVKEMVLEVHPSGMKKARIRLEPPELGEVEVDVRVQHREVSLFLRVEKTEAAHQLHLHLPHLREALQDLGLQLSEFQISYFGSGEGGNLFGENSRGEDFKRRNRTPLESLERVSENREESSRFPEWAPGRLNLVV